jgi:large subunit ribosomal protein L10
MKTKLQKQEQIKKGETLAEKSAGVILLDFAKVNTADLRNLRRDLTKDGSKLFIMKKRLLGIMLTKKGAEFKGADFKTSVGAVFAANLEAASSAVYKFFKGLEKEKKIEGKKILGAYDFARSNAFMPQAEIEFMGSLPPREVLLGQLLGMIAAPIRSLLYVLDQKAKQTK